MYVCLCQGIKERHVRRAVHDGAETVAGVYRCLGKRPECGQCANHMHSMICDLTNEQEAKPAMPLLVPQTG